MRTLTLGYSPCPNDTYIFDALVHNKIRHDFQFEVRLEDVETLNRMALDHQLDITKISTHAWFHVLDSYRLLDSGGALGRGCGPLVVSRTNKVIEAGRIALPGRLTTASLLFRMAVKGDFDFVQMPFNRIISSIQKGETDAGVIIHESRFTYEQSGLFCLLDLGQWWEEKTNCLIPLGGIIISDRIDKRTQIEIQRLIEHSINQAHKSPDSVKGYVRANAQELDERVINSHIDLYVNEYSRNLGEKGRKAVKELYRKSCELNLLPAKCLDREDRLFIN